jgi:opacity protein-like surface antigen
MQWATAAIARLGWLVTPSTLLYGTGGVTYAGFGSVGFNSDTFRAWGWSAGAGVEQKFGPNWSVRVEYRFTDFQARTATFSVSSSSTSPPSNGSVSGPTAFGSGPLSTTSTTTNASSFATRYEPQMHTVRLGIIYAFN